MSDPIQRINATVATQAAPAVVKPSLLSRVGSFVTEVVAIVVWLYVLIELFVFDIDQVFRSSLPPSYSWIVDFKFVLIFAAAALIATFARRWRSWSKLTYIALYPLIVVFWRVPFLILRQRSWPLAIAFINAVASFFGSIRYNLLVGAIFLASASIVLFSKNNALIWVSITALFLLITLAYGRRLISVFKRPQVFKIYEKFAGLMPKIRTSTCKLDDTIKDLPYDQLSAEQAEKWKSNLQSSFVLSRVCLFAARKLRNYSTSGYGKISSAFICVFLTAATIMVFGLINLGLYKIDSTFFRATEVPMRFTFFHYSFNRMFFSSISELEPAKPLAKSIYDGEALFAFFLLVIFVSLLLSARAERQTEELNRAIETLEQESRAMDSAILVEYRFESVDGALAALEKIQTGATSFLQILSRNL